MNYSKRLPGVLFNMMWAVTIFFLFINGCNNKPTEPGTDTNEKIKEQLQLLLDNVIVSDNEIHGALLLVEAPKINLKWKSGVGMANTETELQMNADDQFRIASLGKMTLATLVMKLTEEGHLKLDDPIYYYLPDTIMTGLHMLHGYDHGNQITILQLLSHSSGLPDYVEDGNKDENGMTDFLKLLITQPNKFWKPEETIEYAKHYLSPLFTPGSGYHYSDTNYQLLGLILQNITGKALNVLYREKIFVPLGMNHTYMEYYDDPIPSIPGRGLSHVFLAELDYTNLISNSADWAGGGLISTTEDLNRFLRAFVNDQIFQNNQTKLQMLNWLSTGEVGTYYGLGVARINMDEFGMTGIGELYGHDGFPQSFMFYWPKQNVTIIGTLNQAISNYHYQQLILQVFNLLNK
ncbi:MAG: serine hydrolase domain-containing protein [Bacteroidota bacterium]